MGFLTPPKTNYSNYYDQSRFNLIWRMGIAFMVLIGLVSISNLANPNYTATPNLIGIGLVITALYVLQKTKKYELVSQLLSISVTILVSATFFLIPNVLHYTTPMWMMNNILFTFFMLGSRWGISVLAVHFIVMIFYFFLRIETNINNLAPYTNQDLLNYATEYSICGLGIAYFLYQFIKTNKYAEGRFKLSNRALNEQNQVISFQNQEKEIMLKEIHHRVKNNLQVITSLLRLQSNELKNNEVSVEFNAAIHRINAMALIHEKMYQSNILSDFDLKNYLNSLATDLIESYSLNKNVELQITSNVTKVGSKTIVPLAIIFNELISNSLKHAFVHTGNPLIKVEFLSHETNGFRLIYIDNGIWKQNNQSTFGSELITTMTEQLDGHFELQHSKDGTKYTFFLKNQDEDIQEKI